MTTEDFPQPILEKKMKSFIGCKIVQAEPMRKKWFEERVKGNKYPENQEDIDGYLVVYPDGYKSWSPRNVFQKAYREISDSEKDLI